MMMGKVDNSGRALLSVELRSSVLSTTEELDVWVDTGFTGDLVLPQVLIDELQLPKSGSVDAILADGSQIELNTYTCSLGGLTTDALQVFLEKGGQIAFFQIGRSRNRSLIKSRCSRVVQLAVPGQFGDSAESDGVFGTVERQVQGFRALGMQAGPRLVALPG
jgi:predicted aspartyl protease